MTSCLVSFSVTVLNVFPVFNVFMFAVFLVMSSFGPYVFVSSHVLSDLWSIKPFKQLRVRSLWPPATDWDKQLHSTISVGCSCQSLPVIPASETKRQVLWNILYISWLLYNSLPLEITWSIAWYLIQEKHSGRGKLKCFIKDISDILAFCVYAKSFAVRCRRRLNSLRPCNSY